jgi:putative ABC transport system permease protein
VVRARISALDLKLLRELWRLKGQMGSIALVVAAGIMTVVTMRGGYEGLRDSRARYYSQTRFPDVWVNLKRAPAAVERDLAALDGVAEVDTRVTFLARLVLPGLEGPGTGRFVSLPERGRPVLGDVVVRAGRLPAPGARREALISQSFASARGLEAGDTVRAIINGRAWDVVVTGWGIAAEHGYAVPPGALYPDDERYGIFWMRRDVLGPAYDMDGAFNEAVLTLEPAADTTAVIALVNRALDRYGGLGAYPRSRQFSHQIMDGELAQARVTGTAIPAIFLGVAAFLLNLVLGRLIGTERTEIAVLKAFGYRDREVGGHYLRFALVAVAVGTMIGAGVGLWLGRAYIRLYGEYFDFPDLRYAFSVRLLLIAAGISFAAAIAGALAAVRRAVSLPPAEAMRPEPPATFRPGPLERAGLGRALPAAGRLVLRGLERQPQKAALSSLGVAFSVAILVIGLFLFDGVRFMMELQFGVIQREDLSVTFQEPLAASVRYDLARLEGVQRVETFRTIPARLVAGHRQREVAISGLAPDSRLRRIVTRTRAERPVPAEGMVLSAVLAKELRVRTGDVLDVALLEGRRRTGHVPVAGVIDDFLGVSAIMSSQSLRHLSRDPPLASGAWLAVDDGASGAVNGHLARLPAVAAVASPASVLESFRARLNESLFVSVGFLLGFAVIIAGAVIYNGARIALSERGRELASLRVMGFRKREVARLLLGEQAVVTAVAVPVGWVLGYALSLAVVSALETEAYRIPLVVSARTYALSAAVTIAAAAVSGWIVRRRVHRLDLIAVLKTRE